MLSLVLPCECYLLCRGIPNSTKKQNLILFIWLWVGRDLFVPYGVLASTDKQRKVDADDFYQEQEQIKGSMCN